jgi:hypothetical protein
LQKFIDTARALYQEDNIDTFNDLELGKILQSQTYHLGKSLSVLAETLTWRKNFGVEGILEEDFGDLERCGKYQWFGRTRDGFPILVVVNGRHVNVPRDHVGRDRELRYFVYLLEKARREG